MKDGQKVIDKIPGGTTASEKREGIIRFCMDKLGVDTYFVVTLDSTQLKSNDDEFTSTGAIWGDEDLLAFTISDYLFKAGSLGRKILFNLAQLYIHQKIEQASGQAKSQDY